VLVGDLPWLNVAEVVCPIVTLEVAGGARVEGMNGAIVDDVDGRDVGGIDVNGRNVEGIDVDGATP
jgi:hypothetical protein